MKIGARIIKTGIAVTISMFICIALKLEPAVFGAVSAVINMQPSVYLTFKSTKDQIIIHLLGVLTGLGTGFLLGGNPFSMGLTTILIITIYGKLKLQKGIIMGMVAAVFILDSAPEQFLAHAVSRSGVIFVGLTVAMIINITLRPPRYGNLLLEKLQESNHQAGNYFCQAVHNFVVIDYEPLAPSPLIRDKVIELNNEARTLAEHYQQERKGASDIYNPSDPEKWFLAVEKFIEYNESLVERAERIYELIPDRVERRLKTGAPPISHEFKSILEILDSGCTTINRVNGKLTAMICENATVEPEKISEGYWEKLTGAIEQWQHRLTSSYYLHALIEAAVVANEIRSISRQGKKLINQGKHLTKSFI